MKGYHLFFRREQPDFVPDPSFTPFFWKKKGDDSSDDGPGPDIDGVDALGRSSSPSAARVDIVNPQSLNSLSHDKTVSGGSGDGSKGGGVGSIALTPLNPNPMTPRGKEILAAFRLESPDLIAKSPSLKSMEAGSSAAGAPSAAKDKHASVDGLLETPLLCASPTCPTSGATGAPPSPGSA
jgi:hypothetical protein